MGCNSSSYMGCFKDGTYYGGNPTAVDRVLGDAFGDDITPTSPALVDPMLSGLDIPPADELQPAGAEEMVSDDAPQTAENEQIATREAWKAAAKADLAEEEAAEATEGEVAASDDALEAVPDLN